jgi:beta-glucosidase
LYVTCLPAFEKLVTEAKVGAVMGAYSRLLGEPCCASRLVGRTFPKASQTIQQRQ